MATGGHVDLSGDIVMVSMNSIHDVPSFYKTVKTQLGENGQIPAFLVDEFHHRVYGEKWSEIIEGFKDFADRQDDFSVVVGLTATPRREQDHLIVQKMKISTAMKHHAIPQFKDGDNLVTIHTGIELSGIGVSQHADLQDLDDDDRADFADMNEATQIINTPARNQLIIKSMIDHLPRKQDEKSFQPTLVTLLNRRHLSDFCKQYADYFREDCQDSFLGQRRIGVIEATMTRGQIEALLNSDEYDSYIAAVDGRTEFGKVRDMNQSHSALHLIVNAWKEGQIETVVHCGKFAKGLDGTFIRGQVGARPWLSFLTKKQEFGRITRYSEDELRAMKAVNELVKNGETDVPNLEEIIERRVLIDIVDEGLPFATFSRVLQNSARRRKGLLQLLRRSPHGTGYSNTHSLKRAKIKGSVQKERLREVSGLAQKALQEILEQNYGSQAWLMAGDLGISVDELNYLLHSDTVILLFSDLERFEVLLYLKENHLKEKVIRSDSELGSLESHIMARVLFDSVLVYMSRTSQVDGEVIEINGVLGEAPYQTTLTPLTMSRMSMGQVGARYVPQLASALYYSDVLPQSQQELLNNAMQMWQSDHDSIGLGAPLMGLPQWSDHRAALQMHRQSQAGEVAQTYLYDSLARLHPGRPIQEAILIWGKRGLIKGRFESGIRLIFPEEFKAYSNLPSVNDVNYVKIHFTKDRRARVLGSNSWKQRVAHKNEENILLLEQLGWINLDAQAKLTALFPGRTLPEFLGDNSIKKLFHQALKDALIDDATKVVILVKQNILNETDLLKQPFEILTYSDWQKRIATSGLSSKYTAIVLEYNSDEDTFNFDSRNLEGKSRLYYNRPSAARLLNVLIQTELVADMNDKIGKAKLQVKDKSQHTSKDQLGEKLASAATSVGVICEELGQGYFSVYMKPWKAGRISRSGLEILGQDELPHSYTNTRYMVPFVWNEELKIAEINHLNDLKTNSTTNNHRIALAIQLVKAGVLKARFGSFQDLERWQKTMQSDYNTNDQESVLKLRDHLIHWVHDKGETELYIGTPTQVDSEDYYYLMGMIVLTQSEREAIHPDNDRATFIKIIVQNGMIYPLNKDKITESENRLFQKLSTIGLFNDSPMITALKGLERFDQQYQRDEKWTKGLRRMSNFRFPLYVDQLMPGQKYSGVFYNAIMSALRNLPNGEWAFVVGRHTTNCKPDKRECFANPITIISRAEYENTIAGKSNKRKRHGAVLFSLRDGVAHLNSLYDVRGTRSKYLLKLLWANDLINVPIGKLYQEYDFENDTHRIDKSRLTHDQKLKEKFYETVEKKLEANPLSTRFYMVTGARSSRVKSDQVSGKLVLLTEEEYIHHSKSRKTGSFPVICFDVHHKHPDGGFALLPAFSVSTQSSDSENAYYSGTGAKNFKDWLVEAKWVFLPQQGDNELFDFRDDLKLAFEEAIENLNDSQSVEIVVFMNESGELELMDLREYEEYILRFPTGVKAALTQVKIGVTSEAIELYYNNGFNRGSFFERLYAVISSIYN